MNRDESNLPPVYDLFVRLSCTTHPPTNPIAHFTAWPFIYYSLLTVLHYVLLLHIILY